MLLAGCVRKESFFQKHAFLPLAELDCSERETWVVCAPLDDPWIHRARCLEAATRRFEQRAAGRHASIKLAAPFSR